MIQIIPGANGIGHQLGEAEQACADALAEALELAREGKITSVAIVVCMPNGVGTFHAGAQGAHLYMGCDDIKMKLHKAMFGEDKAAKPNASRIVRPR